MTEPQEIPNDLQGCQALIRAQAATIAELTAVIETQRKASEELAGEIDKLRKLLSYFVNGKRTPLPSGSHAAPSHFWV